MHKSDTIHARNPWVIFAVTAMGTFMATLDSSIVNVALPVITKKLGTDISLGQWIVSGYLLTISSLLPIFGRAGDMYGQRRLYTSGILLFTFSSVSCGLSWSISMLIISRIFQAVGASMMMANAPAIIAITFKPNERGRAFGAIGTVVAMGSIVGPGLGGIIVGIMGWESIFFINIPIGLICFFFGRTILPKGIIKDETFDFAGALLFTSGICSLLITLTHGTTWGWTSPLVLSGTLTGVILLTIFVRVENRVKHPMIDLTMFRIRPFLAGNLSGLCSFIAMFSSTILLPFYLSTVHHLEPARIGLLITPFPLVMGIVSPLSGYMSEKSNPAVLTTTGLGITSISLILLSYLNAGSPIWHVAVLQAMLGLGSGLFQSTNNNSVISSVPIHKTGIAGGISSLVRNIGMMMGIAISISIFQYQRLRFTGGGSESVEAFIYGFHPAIFTGAMIAAAGAFISLNRKGHISTVKDSKI